VGGGGVGLTELSQFIFLSLLNFPIFPVSWIQLGENTINLENWKFSPVSLHRYYRVPMASLSLVWFIQYKAVETN
jgi:hypothetical protein